MNERKYRWQFDRLTALLVGFGNMLIAGLIGFKILSDPYYLKDQLGVALKIPYVIKVLLAFLVFLTMIYVVSDFLKKKHKGRMQLAGIETVLLAFLLRNIFVVFLFEGLSIEPIFMTISLIVLESILIYHTLFSHQINTYFRLNKKKES